MKHSDGLRKLERSGLHVVGATCVLFVCVILYTAIVRPATEQRLADSMKLVELKQVLAKRDKTLQELQYLGSRKDQILQRVNDFRRRMPEKSDLNRLLSELSSLAEAHSIKVLSIQPAQQVVGELVAFQRVRFRLLGSYRATCQVIAGLRELDSLVWVTGAEMSMDESMKRLQPIDLDLVLLYAPPSTKVGKIKVSAAEEKGTET